MGPLHCSPKRAMVLDAAAVRTAEDPEAVIESGQQLRWAHGLRTGGSKLDGQRHAVETAADLRHIVAAGMCVERGISGGSALVEQSHAGFGLERSDGDQSLSREPEPLATWRARARPGIRRRCSREVGQRRR